MSKVILLGGMLRSKGYLMHLKCNPKEKSQMLSLGKLRRQGMSPGSKEIMRTSLLSNKSKRDLLHHLLVHLHPEIKMSTLVRIHSTLGLDLPNRR
ncbi:hypothetical protein H5410_028030, partial [Solanum commersonii]